MGDIDARREARRRKILQNSERRLQKITGVENKTSTPEIEGLNTYKPFEVTQEANSSPILEKHAYFTQEEGLLNLSSQYETSKDDIQTVFYNSRLSENASIGQLESRVTDSGHFYIFILSIVWNLLISIYDILQIDTNILHINKIFLPLIAFEIYDYWFSPNFNKTFNLLSSVILLSGRSYSRKLNAFVQRFIKILQDIMIYFFVFVASRLFMKIMFLSSK